MAHSPADADPRHDAERLYRAVFGAAAPRAVIDRYLEASALLDAAATPEARAAYRRALAGVRDVEALEVAARYRRRLPLLSEHMRLMVYLAESAPENQRYFVKRRPSRAAAWTVLFAGAFRTAYKLAKGALLLARVRDV